MKLKDYTQGKSVKELIKLYRKGKLLAIDYLDKGRIVQTLWSKSYGKEKLSKKDQLRAVVLLDEKNYPVNNVLLNFQLHPETLELLELDRHESTRVAAYYHQSQPLEVLMARGEAGKYPAEFYSGLNCRKLDRVAEVKLLKVTTRNNLTHLFPHLTPRVDDEEFQSLLLEAIARSSKVGRQGALTLKIWSPESLDRIQRDYSDDLLLLKYLSRQEMLSEEASMKILSGKTTHVIRGELAAHTRHRFIWEQLASRSKALAAEAARNPYFGDNERAEAYRKTKEGNSDGT